MKFARRTDGMKSSRAIFKQAREDHRSRYHVYIAAAYTEFYCSKDANIALNIFGLGLKKYSDEANFAIAYLEFLMTLNGW
jgi:cleavage stimulation factor subunit 3